MGDECRTRVHEDAHEYRCHGKWDDINAEEVMTHDEWNKNREQRYHRIEHGDAAGLVEIVFSEQAEVAGEHDDQDEDEENLTDDGCGDFVCCRTAALHLFVKRTKHTVGIVGNHFTTVYDFLTAHHHATGERNTAEHIILLGFTSFFVVNEVCLYIIIKVAAWQNLALGGYPFVEEYSLVCSNGRIETANRDATDILSADDADHARGVFIDTVVFRGIDDSGLIDFVQLLGYELNILFRQSGNALAEIV